MYQATDERAQHLQPNATDSAPQAILDASQRLPDANENGRKQRRSDFAECRKAVPLL